MFAISEGWSNWAKVPMLKSWWKVDVRFWVRGTILYVWIIFGKHVGGKTATVKRQFGKLFYNQHPSKITIAYQYRETRPYCAHVHPSAASDELIQLVHGHWTVLVPQGLH